MYFFFKPLDFSFGAATALPYNSEHSMRISMRPGVAVVGG